MPPSALPGAPSSGRDRERADVRSGLRGLVQSRRCSPRQSAAARRDRPESRRLRHGLDHPVRCDNAGNVSDWSGPRCSLVDGAAPRLRPLTGPAPFDVTGSDGKIRFGYSATDDFGVLSYDVQTRTAAPGSLLGPWTNRASATTNTELVAPAAPGIELCVRFRARDLAGNVTGWSTPPLHRDRLRRPGPGGLGSHSSHHVGTRSPPHGHDPQGEGRIRNPCPRTTRTSPCRLASTRPRPRCRRRASRNHPGRPPLGDRTHVAPGPDQGDSRHRRACAVHGRRHSTGSPRRIHRGPLTQGRSRKAIECSHNTP